MVQDMSPLCLFITFRIIPAALVLYTQDDEALIKRRAVIQSDFIVDIFFNIDCMFSHD